MAMLAFAGACSESSERTLAPAGDETVSSAIPAAQFAPLLGLRPIAFTEYTLIREPALGSVLRLSKLIGPEGGLLEVGNHVLSVPRGAVSVPAIFTLLSLPTGYVEVELLALAPALLGRLSDVGSRGFRRPVQLTLSYARATNVGDPDDLVILRLKPNGRHEPLRSSVDATARTVTAELGHFSRYCMASN
jgi:hypothetical protein